MTIKYTIYKNNIKHTFKMRDINEVWWLKCEFVEERTNLRSMSFNWHLTRKDNRSSYNFQHRTNEQIFSKLSARLNSDRNVETNSRSRWEGKNYRASRQDFSTLSQANLTDVRPVNHVIRGSAVLGPPWRPE